MLTNYNHPNLQKLEDMIVSQLEDEDLIEEIRLEGVEEFLNLEDPIRMNWVLGWDEAKINEMVETYLKQLKNNLRGGQS